MRWFPFDLFGTRSLIAAAENSRLLDVIAKNRKLRAELQAEYSLRKAAEALAEARRVELLNAETEGPKRTLEKENDAQSARSMSRQTKQHFQEYQQAVSLILDEVDRITRKNFIGPEERNRLRGLRNTLSQLIGRSI